MQKKAALRAGLIVVATASAVGVGVWVLAAASAPRDLEREALATPSASANAPRAVIGADESLDAQWRAIALRFPDALRPAGEELHRYSPGDFPYGRAACLENVGAGGFDETGYGIAERNSDDVDIVLEGYLCAVRFPVIGDAAPVVPLGSAEVTRLYAELADYSACVVESGEWTGHLVSQAEFEENWPAVGQLPLPPHGIRSAGVWQEIEQWCPEPSPRS